MFEPLSIAIRVLLAVIFLFTTTKILTKRSLSSLTYFDYIAISTLGTIAGNLAFNIKIHFLNLILAMLLITTIILLASYVSLKCITVRKFLAGEPTILIEKGKILEKNLANLNYSYDYLNQQLRQKQIFDINKVEFAFLEPNGKLSVKLKSQNRPLTPEDINLPTAYEGLAVEIILDGKILEKNLHKKGLDYEWLYNELNKRGIRNIKQVAFAALSTNGKLYIDFYNDSN